MSKKLVFVYNGNSGAINGLIHYLHKKISPETYECQLCSLVYDGMSMNKEWMSFVKSLNIPTEFTHRNTFRKKYGDLTENFPAIFLFENEKVIKTINASRINELKTLKDLMEEVNCIDKDL